MAIYFLFALVMLPLVRRVGVRVTVVAAWIVGLLPFFALPLNQSFYWACPWFLGSFALGMLAALQSFGPKAAPPCHGRWSWATVFCFALLVPLSVRPVLPLPLVDLLVSMLAYCSIRACVVFLKMGAARNLLMRFLESRALVYLGGFSYSLYLVQHPLLRLSEQLLARFGLSSNGSLLTSLLLSTPFIIAVAGCSRRLFERPFTSGGVLLPAYKRRHSLARPAATPL
jgi:peptidoglycan/LPS O-acetylase OafA/YrhL